MTQNFLDFIQQRRPTILAEMKALEAELKQLDIAEKALGVSPTDQNLTIKEMILGVLSDAGHGLRSGDILAHVKEKYAVDVARESLSPQLTRLSKDDEKIVLNGRKWSLLG